MKDSRTTRKECFSIAWKHSLDEHFSAATSGSIPNIATFMQEKKDVALRSRPAGMGMRGEQ